MGAKNSKTDDEEGLPVRYARGCASSEFSRIWEKGDLNSSTRLIQGHVKTFNDKSVCGNTSESKQPRVHPLKKYTCSSKLQSIGIGSKQRSYLDQLIELRLRNGEEVFKKPMERKQRNVLKFEKRTEELSDDDIPVLINRDQSLSIEEQTSSQAVDVYSVVLTVPKAESSSISWSSSDESEENSAENIPVDNGPLNIRSDVTVVPFSTAKARFETGRCQRAPKKCGDYRQLEELGLGHWNNEQWVPTKVVTTAISDQLTCSLRNSMPYYKQLSLQSAH